jgi:hypothetical protein
LCAASGSGRPLVNRPTRVIDLTEQDAGESVAALEFARCRQEPDVRLAAQEVRIIDIGLDGRVLAGVASQPKFKIVAALLPVNAVVDPNELSRSQEVRIGNAQISKSPPGQSTVFHPPLWRHCNRHMFISRLRMPGANVWL